MSTHLIDSVLTWNGSREGLAFSEPLALAPYAGQRLEIEVDADQVVLVVVRGDVVATLLPAHHKVIVLAPGEERGDLDRATLQQRLGLDDADLGAVEESVRALPCEALALYVGFESLPVMEWGQSGTTPFHDATQGRVELGIEGAFRLRVNDVVRFYRSFLRNTEDLPPEHFATTAGALLHACLVRSLGRRAERWEDLPKDRRRLGDVVREDLVHGLGVVGLELEELEVTRLELPTGMVRVHDAPRPQVVPG